VEIANRDHGFVLDGIPGPWASPARSHGRSFLALGRTITNISPQITSAVIPKKIQSDANTARVSTAPDVITRAGVDRSSRPSAEIADPSRHFSARRVGGHGGRRGPRISTRSGTSGPATSRQRLAAPAAYIRPIATWPR
jgi:hypothetical protein